MFSLKCKGCKVKYRVHFHTWWFYFMQADDEHGGPYFHEQCYEESMSNE